MFTYKFVGLLPADSRTPYYYGSLPNKAAPGQWLHFDETENWYRVEAVDGEPLTGADERADQHELAVAEISRDEAVPMLTLKHHAWPEGEGPFAVPRPPAVRPQGRSIDEHEILHLRHQRNLRLQNAKSAKAGS
ncbi:MAG: hypothetical protein WB985_12255 [Candidatus Acidiferrales bacterium]